jgi:hypothetical protein
MSRVATILSITVFAIAFAPIANSADSTTVSTDHAAGTTTTTVHTTTVHHHHSHHHFHPVNEASKIIHHPVHETSEAIHDATGTKPERPKPLN